MVPNQVLYACPPASSRSVVVRLAGVKCAQGSYGCALDRILLSEIGDDVEWLSFQPLYS